MAKQIITDNYAIYLADCMDIMQAMFDKSVHLSVYSPPFGGLYIYSSDDRDLSNYAQTEDFLEHYAYVVKEIFRLTLPGRMTAVHCMDIPRGGYGNRLMDFPGMIIKLHEEHGWHYVARYHVWKEPLTVRNRTMMKSLHHKTIVVDSSKCAAAGADYLLLFRKTGENPVPIEHPNGFLDYAGAREIPEDLKRYKGYKGNQIQNRFSHWIWQQYASAFWDDIRLDNVIPFKESREDEDEKHIHPLQLDVIERCLVLWSNPGETVLTPFMGVGSEVYCAVENDRKGIGIELKESYFNQAVKNLESIKVEQKELF